MLLGELGFDAAVDHRSPTFVEDLASATPDGIDVYFENVGGGLRGRRTPAQPVRADPGGLIARYNDAEVPSAIDRLPDFMRRVLTLSLTVRGFIQAEFEPTHHEAFLQEIGARVRDGSVRYREDVVEGLEKAPEAFR